MLSKKDQTKKSGKIRKKEVKDREYLSDLKKMDLKCIVCGCSGTELHHCYSVVRGIERSDHLVVSLCPEHHRGSKCSPHGGKAEFYKIFSFDTLLLIAQKIRENYLKEKNDIN